MTWESVIGLEIHAQLKTKSKIFSGAATQYGAPPNTQACAIDLGMPGTLPVLNKEVVLMAVKFGLAINAEIPEKSIFARKNYFYPDLPKGYQISQLSQPIVSNGYIEINIDHQIKRINITRAHLEEDAGKLLHEDYRGMTAIDLNRAGTPLLEIVSDPDLRSATEAVNYMKSIHTLVRYLNICDGNMQEGSFRCDANVSVRRHGEKNYGTRTEIKNLNSFRFIEKAINYEIERQIAVIENGGTITQETRLYDANKNLTRPMRSKEEANDYRYFPDPDLLPVDITTEMIAEIRKTLPELPQQKYKRYIQTYELMPEIAAYLSESWDLANYFETVLKHANCQPKLAANWITGDLLAQLNKNELDITQSPIPAEQLAKLLQRINDNIISNKIAKTVFLAMWQGESDVDAIIEKQGLAESTDIKELERLIDEMIAKNSDQVAQYRAGKEKVFGFFVGQMMKLTQGKANPQQLNQLLKQKLQ